MPARERPTSATNSAAPILAQARLRRPATTVAAIWARHRGQAQTTLPAWIWVQLRPLRPAARVSLQPRAPGWLTPAVRIWIEPRRLAQATPALIWVPPLPPAREKPAEQFSLRPRPRVRASRATRFRATSLEERAAPLRRRIAAEAALPEPAAAPMRR